ncbi:hypothetical protein COLO4_24167 [Corchorus olitorius]|uniref:Transposase, Ptta/En/Spm, plant n=1 Tax=Corchorus olitorius TaxID=93759 RepID=A0A1R3ICK3_9ROSI|nr:hypothetical protein COLO4_24167 [Corchorus olitorius]
MSPDEVARLEEELQRGKDRRRDLEAVVDPSQRPISLIETIDEKVMKGVGKGKSQKAKCGKKMQPQLKPPPGFVCEKSLYTQCTPLTKFPRGSSTTAQGNPAKGLLAARKAIPTQTESSKRCPADESDDEYGSEDDHDMTTPSELPDHREKNGRGQYKGQRLDLKTQAGTVKLTVRLASDRLRPVGPTARDLANYCGYTVRTLAPIDAKNWEKAYRSSGEEMLNAIKKVSERNFSNAKKRKKFHSTGNKSFAEFEDDLEKMTSLIDDPSEEVPRTRDEIHIGAMGGRSGYCRGFGYGKQGLIKRTRASRSLLEQRNQKIEELREKMANMEAEQEEKEARTQERFEELEKRHAEQLEKMRAEFLSKLPTNWTNDFPSFEMTPTQTQDK